MEKENTIDILELIIKLKNRRKLILISILISFLIGTIISIVSKDRYTAQTIFIPQTDNIESNITNSGLGGLASLAGIDIGRQGSSGQINPLMYPRLAENYDFILRVLDNEIPTSSYKKINLEDHIRSHRFIIEEIIATIKKYTIGLPSLIFSSKKSKIKNELEKTKIKDFSGDEKRLISIFSRKYSVSVNKLDGYVTVTATDKDPVIAAEMVKILTEKLQTEIINKRIEKQKLSLEFTQNQYQLKLEEFKNVQDKLGRFKDRNQNISSSLIQNQLDRIEDEYSILLSVVQGLATEVESAKLRVNKDTPIFLVIKPVSVPFSRSSIDKEMIILIWIFLGLFISSTYVLSEDPIKKIINKLKIKNK